VVSHFCVVSAQRVAYIACLLRFSASTECTECVSQRHRKRTTRLFTVQVCRPSPGYSANMKVALCTLVLATAVVLASALPSPKSALSSRSARTTSLFLETDAQATCPVGELCCSNGQQLEMCKWRDGICCGNQGFCCPSGTSCSSSTARPHCIRQLSTGSSPMLGSSSASASGSSMPAPGPADNSAESSLPESSGPISTQASGDTKTTQSDGNTIILSNGNKITSVTRQVPPGMK